MVYFKIPKDNKIYSSRDPDRKLLNSLIFHSTFQVLQEKLVLIFMYQQYTDMIDEE